MQHPSHFTRFGSGPSLRMVLIALLAATAARPAAAQDTGVMQDNVVVLLDSSGSMKERMGRSRRPKMEVAKEALAQVIEEIPDTTNVGLLVFGGKGQSNRWLYPLSPLDRAALGAAIQIPVPSGGTPLGRYMKIAADALLAQRKKQFGYGSYRLLIVTDGEAGDQVLVEKYTPDVLSRGITVDVIGVDMAGDHTLATRVNSYRKADDPESLVRAVAEVFGEVALSADDATNEEHFALIAGIPDDMALSMIQALARSGNHPIGERPARPERGGNAGSAKSSSDSTGGGALPGGRSPVNSPGSSPGSPSSSGGSSFLLIIVTIFVLAVVLKVVIKAARA